MSTTPMRVFLALPDRGLDPAVERALREAIVAAKHEILPDAPAAHPGIQKSERDRFLTIVDRMMEAEMLVADLSVADAGVGWCVAWMLARGRLVVLSIRQDARAALPAMIVGNPSPWQKIVIYTDATELRGALEKALSF